MLADGQGRVEREGPPADDAGAEVLHGKELSYNNLLDSDAAWNLVLEFQEPAFEVGLPSTATRMFRYMVKSP